MIAVMPMIDDYQDSDDDQNGLDHEKEDIYEDYDNWRLVEDIYDNCDNPHICDNWRRIFMTITQTSTISRPSSCRQNLFTFCSNRSCFSPLKVFLLFCPKRILQLFCMVQIL